MTHEEWIIERSGKVTASIFGAVLRAQNRTTLTAIARKILDAKPEDFDRGGSTDARGWGKAYEDEARSMYALVTGSDIEPPPIFFLDPHDPLVGCSPDGWDKTSGHGIEIKCPTNPAVLARARYVRTPGPIFELRPDWEAQVQGSMLVTDARRWTLILYDPVASVGDRVVGRLNHWTIERNERLCARLRKKIDMTTAILAKLAKETHP